MSGDRTTKALLVLIAVALWGILLRPLVAPGPAQAQAARGATGQIPAITSVGGAGSEGLVYLVVNGKISLWKSDMVLPSKTKNAHYVWKLFLLDTKPLP